MNRMYRKWILPLVLGTLLAAMSLSALAADSFVHYEGGAQKFITEPADGNLFQNFTGVLPGDRLLQTVTVDAHSLSKDTRLNVYLRADSTDPADQAFLSRLRLIVRQGDTVLSDGTADQPGGLRENRLLGTFHSNDNTVLTVELQVPADLDNTYQNTKGTVYWIFTAEELADQGKDTGDQSAPGRWMAIAAAAVLAGGATLIFLRKQQDSSVVQRESKKEQH